MPDFLIRIELRKKPSGGEPSNIDYEALHKELLKMQVSRVCYSRSKKEFYRLPPATYGVVSEMEIASLHSAIEASAQRIWRGPLGIVMAQEAGLMQASGLEISNDAMGVAAKYIIDVN